MYDPTQNYTESKPLELEESVDIIEARKPDEQVIDETSVEEILESKPKTDEAIINEAVEADEASKMRERLRKRHLGF